MGWAYWGIFGVGYKEAPHSTIPIDMHLHSRTRQTRLNEIRFPEVRYPNMLAPYTTLYKEKLLHAIMQFFISSVLSMKPSSRIFLELLLFLEKHPETDNRAVNKQAADDRHHHCGVRDDHRMCKYRGQRCSHHVSPYSSRLTTKPSRFTYFNQAIILKEGKTYQLPSTPKTPCKTSRNPLPHSHYSQQNHRGSHNGHISSWEEELEHRWLRREGAGIGGRGRRRGLRGESRLLGPRG